MNLSYRYCQRLKLWNHQALAWIDCLASAIIIRELLHTVADYQLERPVINEVINAYSLPDEAKERDGERDRASSGLA